MRTVGVASTLSMTFAVTVTSTICWFGGQIDDGDAVREMISGGSRSSTWIRKLPLASFSWASLAEQTTVVVPRGNVEPDGGAQVTGTDPSTRSLAVAVYVPTAPAALVAASVVSGGRESTGGVVSTTVTLNEIP